MGGALKSVFGGSGGIFGAVLGVASMFFPPLALASSMSNLLTSAIGEAVKMAASRMVSELGMPKFLQGIINQVVDAAVSQHTQPSSPDVDQYTQEHAAPALNQFKKEGADALFDAVAKLRRQNLESTDEQRNKTKTSGKQSAGSWLEAIAQNMGDALGAKAAKMVDLSNEIARTAGQEGKEAAAANTKATTEMTATSQMFNLMNNAFTNALKTIGEGLTQAARKG